MKLGIYLKGGGAKGAFQAGVIKALTERGLTFQVIAGTSIGAVNGYFLGRNALDKLEALYMSPEDTAFQTMVLSGKTIKNNHLIQKLEEIHTPLDETVQGFLVNYCLVQNGQLIERVEDLRSLTREASITRIKWSARLPYNHPPMTFQGFIRYIQEHDITAEFKADLQNQVYDGWKLDGGLVNNLFIREILAFKPDKVIIVGYNGTRDEYLQGLDGLTTAEKAKLIYIARGVPFAVTDTYQFNQAFLQGRFLEGYATGRSLELPL